MTIAMVGSKALEKAVGGMYRPLGDIDLVCTENEFMGLAGRLESYSFLDTEEGRAMKVKSAGKEIIIEAEFTEGEGFETSDALHERVLSDGIETKIFGIPVVSASLNTLYELKMSHRFRKVNSSLGMNRFFKTMQDIHFMRSRGATIENEEFLALREAETYAYGHPSLAVKKDDFFQDMGELQYAYDHDTLHEAVAVGDRPAYTYYLKDGETVMCDKRKFFALDQETRLRGILEESYVLALERSVVPHRADPRKAFQMAIVKVCTSITSGWFREYGWENFFQVDSMYNGNYVEKFEDALQRGIVQPFKGSMY